mmetsp:Transcript_29438/g.29839  ORF Transcript_29438/g.29839 Transcript_29438/m.29839 type:complete len:212 (-) Transcript_29438:2-637(-)
MVEIILLVAFDCHCLDFVSSGGASPFKYISPQISIPPPRYSWPELLSLLSMDVTRCLFPKERAMPPETTGIHRSGISILNGILFDIVEEELPFSLSLSFFANDTLSSASDTMIPHPLGLGGSCFGCRKELLLRSSLFEGFRRRSDGVIDLGTLLLLLLNALLFTVAASCSIFCCNIIRRLLSRGDKFIRTTNSIRERNEEDTLISFVAAIG